MRGRRNTHISTSSTSSSTSSDSPCSTPARNSLSEKDVERQIDEDVYLLDEAKDKPLKHQQHNKRFYIYASILCIVLFMTFSIGQQSILAAIHPRDHGPPTRPAATLLHQTPAAVAFEDERGRTRWSVAIPSNSSFPLPNADYDNICREAIRLSPERPATAYTRFWDSTHTRPVDHSYIDVDEAQSSGVLTADTYTAPHTCRSSLTLIIDPTEASFGKTLLLIWLSYGFAKREGKAFFLDDSRWLYGRYDSYFPPLPRPGCSRPPSTHVVPCPLQAKHLVITASTAPLAFQRHNKLGMIFDLMRAGYEASFSLIGEDASYAKERIKQLRALAEDSHQPLIGMHIRRGDLHPFELQYSQDYLPLDKFTDVAKHMLNTPAALVMASDDPDIIESSELTLAASPHTLHKSQERIQLATKLALDRTSPAVPIREPGSAYVKHVDENAGWDGGFYTALFHSSGGHNAQRVLSSTPSKATMQLRELIGRGYLLDLAILSHSDTVICAVSSASCRLLAVMKGKSALQTGAWINVDDRRPWSWDGHRRH